MCGYACGLPASRRLKRTPEHAHSLRGDAVAGVLQRRAARHGLRGGREEGQGPHRDNAEGAENYEVSAAGVSCGAGLTFLTGEALFHRNCAW